MDLNKIANEALSNALLRQSNGAHIDCDTFHMLKHTATEVIEAMDAYNRYDFDRKTRRGYVSEDEIVADKKQFESELADIICCVLIISSDCLIDIEQAVKDCIEKNRKRAEGTGDKK